MEYFTNIERVLTNSKQLVLDQIQQAEQEITSLKARVAELEQEPPTLPDQPKLQIKGVSSNQEVEGNLYVVVEPSVPIESMRFEIPGVISRLERNAPYALMGDDGPSVIYPWDTTTVENGHYTLTVTANTLNGEVISDTVSFVVKNKVTIPSTPSEDWTDPRPDVHTIELSAGDHRVTIPRDRRRPDQWVVVRGPREARIVAINDISTPSLVRFEGVTITTKLQGRDGGEFAFINCRIEVQDLIAWGVSKLHVHGCTIHSKQSVFPSGAVDAVNNIVESYGTDLIRSNSGRVDGLTIMRHTRSGDSHPDVFEFDVRHGNSNLVIRNITGPSNGYAEIGESQGLAGGNVDGLVLENIKIQINRPSNSGISAVQLGGEWRNVKASNVDIRGGPTRWRNDFKARNFRVKNCPQLERLPGVIVE